MNDLNNVRDDRSIMKSGMQKPLSHFSTTNIHKFALETSNTLVTPQMSFVFTPEQRLFSPDTNRNARPPTTFKEKRMRKSAIRADTQNKQYLQDLKLAWNNADPEHRGCLNYDQWISSSLRFIIGNGKLSQDEFEQYFYKIDANDDGEVDWMEFSSYVMHELASEGLSLAAEPVRSIQKSPTPRNVKQHFHRYIINQIFHSPWTKEYVTVSTDAVRFWGDEKLTFRRELRLKDSFSCGCSLRQYPIIAIATTTRRLFFYSVADSALEQLPVGISASPSAKTIKRMAGAESVQVLSALKNKTSCPMFNIPVVMIEAELHPCPKYSCQIVVGDDVGCIEVFQLQTPQRRTGHDYSLERIAHKQMHDSTISQICVIDAYQVYATSSHDGKVKFWRCDLSVTREFDEGVPIQSFVFSAIQGSLIVCGSGRIATVWSYEPVMKVKRLVDSNSPSTLITDFVTSEGEKFFVTFNARKEIFLWDGTNLSLKGQWTDSDYLPPENKYGAVYFDHNRHVIVVAAGYPIFWAEREMTQVKGVTHPSEIIGCHYSKDYDQLVTVDHSPTYVVWNYKTGERVSTRRPDFPEICSSTLDIQGRRLMSVTYDGQVNQWNYSAGTIISNADACDTEQISVLEFFGLGNRAFFITAGWSHKVYLYREIDKIHYRLVKVFEGHTDDICAAAVESSGWLVSGSVNGEIFVWGIDSACKPKSTKIDAPVEVMQIYDHHLFVADSNGYLYILTVPGLEHVERVKAHQIMVRHAISAMIICEVKTLLITADTLGYVRTWKLVKTKNQRVQAEPINFMRCHESEISHMSFIGKGDYFATAGTDMAVRMWESDTCNLVGTFGGDKWVLSNVSTWVKESPAVENPIHFSGNTPKNPITRIRSRTSMHYITPQLSPSSRRRSEHFLEKQTPSAPNEEVEEEQAFDFEKIQQTLQFISSANLDLIKQDSYDEIELEMERPRQKLDLYTIPMKSESQTREMMERIKNLQNRKPKKLLDFMFSDPKKK